MQTATPAFATAVINQDQQIAYVVTIGFPVSGTLPVEYQNVSDTVISIENDAAVTTTSPDGTLLIAGYPSAQPTIELSGMLKQPTGTPQIESQTIYWLMNPNDPTSPMFRQTRAGLSVTIQAGLYDGQANPELITIFTGAIDTCLCSDGVVTLTCLDNRATITNQSVLPPVITSPPYNAGLTSQYAIDYLFRHASPKQYYSWPAQRPNCIFSAGLRSSIWPEVGSYSSYSSIPMFGQGRYGTALTGTGGVSLLYDLSAPIVPTQTSFFFESWLSNGTQMWVTVAGSPEQILGVQVTTTHVFVYTLTPGGTGNSGLFAIAITTPTYIGVEVSWASGSVAVSGTLYIGTGANAFSFNALDARSSTANMVFAGLAVDDTVAGASAEAFQVSLESAGIPNGSFSPTLLLDPSLNPLTALPDVTGQDAWATFQDIASAEYGIIGFNELGQAYFKNRYTIDQTVAVRTVTSSTSLMTLDTSEQLSTVATHIQIPVNQLSIAAGGNIWSAATVLAIPAGGSITFVATTQNPVVNVSLTDSGFQPDPPSGVAGDTYWRGCTTADGTGTAVTTGISVSIVQLSGTALQVTVTNTNSFIVYLSNPPGNISPEGLPSLAIGGQAITSTNSLNSTGNSTGGGTLYADAQWPPLSSGGAITNTQFGEILLQVSSNAWIQDLPTAEQLADDLLDDLHSPRPLYRNVSMVCDPRLQMVDRITLVDPDVSQTNSDAVLVGITTKLGGNTWTQTIDARACYTPGGWILGLVGHSELGSTTYLLEP